MDAASHDLADEIGEDLASMFGGDQASANVEVIKTLPNPQQLLVKDAYFRSLRSVWIMVSSCASLLMHLLTAIVRGGGRLIVHRQPLSPCTSFERYV